MPAFEPLRSRLTTAGGPNPVAVAVLVLLWLSMLALATFIIVAGAPWLAMGYWLTDDSATSA